MPLMVTRAPTTGAPLASTTWPEKVWAAWRLGASGAGSLALSSPAAAHADTAAPAHTINTDRNSQFLVIATLLGHSHARPPGGHAATRRFTATAPLRAAHQASRGDG